MPIQPTTEPILTAPIDTAVAESQDACIALPAIQPVDPEVDVEVLRSIPKQFTVEDEGSANWVVKKIVAARNYAQHVKAWSEQEQRRAEREEQALLFLFGRQLQAWTKDQISTLGGRRKSLNLPAGVVGFRHEGARLVVDDETLVLKWAQKNCPEAVVVVTKLSRSVLNERFKSTGEVPELGVHVEPQHERFGIR